MFNLLIPSWDYKSQMERGDADGCLPKVGTYVAPCAHHQLDI